MTSGARFGLRRTLPHLCGVTLGFVYMLVLVGAGIGGALAASPLAGEVLRWACVLILVRLAFALARAGRTPEAAQRARPLTFPQAAGFQWLNPKSWAMALTAVGTWAPGADPATLLPVALVFGVVNLPATGLWAVLGLRLRALLALPGRRQAFDLVMAALLLGSGLPLLLA